MLGLQSSLGRIFAVGCLGFGSLEKGVLVAGEVDCWLGEWWLRDAWAVGKVAGSGKRPERQRLGWLLPHENAQPGHCCRDGRPLVTRPLCCFVRQEVACRAAWPCVAGMPKVSRTEPGLRR